MKRYLVRSTAHPESLDWSTANGLVDFTFPWEERPAPHTEFRALWSDSQGNVKSTRPLAVDQSRDSGWAVERTR